MEFGGRAKPDIIDFGGLARFFQLDQLVIDRFQQRRFAFLDANADLLFAQQIGDDFKVSFVRRLCQQASEDGAVLGDGGRCRYAGRSAPAEYRHRRARATAETLMQRLFAGSAFDRADPRFAVAVELVR